MVMEHLLEFTQLVHIPCSLHFHSSKLEIGYIILRMDAKYFREKSEFCFQLADGLSLNCPSRFKLMELAEDFRERAKELEAQAAQHRQADSLNAERDKRFRH